MIALVFSVFLATRLRHRVSRIFAIAAIVSFFLVILVIAEIPESEVTDSRTIFIASTTLAGIVFTLVALINMFFQNIMGRSKKNKITIETDNSEEGQQASN